MTRYWPSSFFCVFTDQVEVVVNNNPKKEQYLAVLTVQVWSINDLKYGQKENFSCGNNAGNPKPVRATNQNSGFTLINKENEKTNK